ncbi:hypothetical protein POMI540_1252 [Schizosaccharomyces pombe]
MREFRLIFVLLFFLPSFAIANTEIINVETGDSNKLLTSNSVCDIELSNNSSIPLLLKPNPTIPQAAGAPQQSKYTFSVCGLKPLHKYQIRASWPAVYPSDIILNYNITHIIVEINASFYSHNESLMKRPPLVPLRLVVEPLLLGFLPKSVLPIVGFVFVIILIALICMTNLFIKHKRD